MVLDDYGEISGVDIRQLGAVAVSTPNNPLLRIIIVGTREKVSKDKFGIPKTFLLVHLYRDPTKGSVILDSHRATLLVDGDGDGTDLFGMERVTINGIDQDLIKDFQEGWGILQVLLGEGRTIKDPVGFRTQLNWTDIGVRSLENVFDMGEFLDTLHTFLILSQLKTLT